MGAVEQPVQERHYRAVGRAVVHRAGDDQAVALLKDLRGLVHPVVKGAFSLFEAAPAGDAAADRLVPHADRLRLHAGLVKDLVHLGQRQSGVALETRAAVDHQHLHAQSLRKMYFIFNSIMQ